MTLVELLLVAIGLSMDAFAVAVGKGLSMRRLNLRHAAVIALFFGGFQALMPFIGCMLGSQFASIVEPVDHWIAFVLLAFIGAKMIVDAVREGAETDDDPGSTPAQADMAASTTGGLDLRELLLLAVATSIDALATGITLAFLRVDIVSSVAIIGVTTFVLSFAGVAIGHAFGARWERPSAFAGGIILIFIGAKILVEHLGLL